VNVILVPIKPIHVEEFKKHPSFGRFTIRDIGRIVGVGKVNSVTKNDNNEI